MLSNKFLDYRTKLARRSFSLIYKIRIIYRQNRIKKYNRLQKLYSILLKLKKHNFNDSSIPTEKLNSYFALCVGALRLPQIPCSRHWNDAAPTTPSPSIFSIIF
jgi:hypothetical protein